MEKDDVLPETSGLTQFERLQSRPIPDELNRAIEEVFQQDAKARNEIKRLSVLEFVKRRGGKIKVGNFQNDIEDLEVKEMSMEEKYDKLYDQFVVTDVIALDFIKEMGLTDKFMDHQMKIFKKSIPSMMGPVFKLIKMLAPGRAFKMLVKEMLKELQVLDPPSSIELVSLSDREAVIKQKNSVLVKKYRDIIKKTGLKLDFKEMLEITNESWKEMLKNFGFEYDEQVKGDAIITTVKLPK
jgi:hypothetical protein